MASRLTIDTINLGDIRPYGWDAYKSVGAGKTMGHEFELQININISQYLSTGKRRRSGPGDGEHTITWAQKGTWSDALRVDAECKQMPLLEWKEQIRFYRVAANGDWTYVGEHNVDMFQHAPRAKTFAGFYPGISIGGGDGFKNPWKTPLFNPCMLPLTTLDEPDKFYKLKSSEKTEKCVLLFREKKKTLVAKITDRPGMTKNPSGGPMAGGGGLAPLVNDKSRARVLHFTLGFAGTGLGRVMCTQILESQNGVPTICKFVKRRLSVTEAERPQNHAHWRGQYDDNDYKARGNWNFLL